MVKLLKWDFINFYKKYFWLYLSFAVIWALVAVFPDHIPLISLMVDELGVAFSLLFYCYTMIVALLIPVSWLRKDSVQLELSVPVQPEKILLSKLLLAVVVSTSSLLLTELLLAMIHQFGAAHMILYKGFAGFLQYMGGMVSLTVIIMFSYMAAKSLRFTRHPAGIASLLLLMIIGTLLGGLVLLCFDTAGIWKVTFAKGGYLFIKPGEHRALMPLGELIVGLAIVVAGFWGSSLFFKYKLEL